MRALSLLALLALAACGGAVAPVSRPPLPDVGLALRLSPPMSPDLARAIEDNDYLIDRSRYDRAIDRLELRARLNGF